MRSDLVRLTSPQGSRVVVPAETAEALGSGWIPVAEKSETKSPGRPKRAASSHEK